MGEKGQPANTAAVAGVTANNPAAIHSTGAGIATATATTGGVSAGAGSSIAGGGTPPTQTPSLGAGTQGPMTSAGAQVPGQGQSTAAPSGEKGLDLPSVVPEMPPNPALGLV